MGVEVVTLDGHPVKAGTIKGVLLEISDLGILIKCDASGTLVFSSSATLKAAGESDDR